ncbi:MAG: MFS transporter [Treponema sp.]|jgi:MFS family permease|nr:MFS transporter [Treponema sp.]
MNTEEKIPVAQTIAVMCVFSLTMTLGSITPVMAKIYEAYSNIPTAIVTYVSSIASIVSILSSMFVGMLAGKKLGFKPTIFVLVVIFIAGGCVPAFIQGFPALLISRGVFGLAMGGLSVLGNPLVTVYYPENKRAGILGNSVFAAFGGAMILQYAGAFLADIQWYYAFLTHALAVIPLILILVFLPKTETAQDASFVKQKLFVPPKAVSVSIVFAAAWLFVTPLLFMSSVLAGTISKSSVTAATVTMFYSLGSLAGGLIFGKLYALAKNKCIGISLLLVAAGMFGAAISGNIALLCACMLIAGVGYCTALPAIMMIIGIVTLKPSVAFATALLMVFMNVASFLESGWIGLIEHITGDPVYMPIFVGAALMVLLGVSQFLINPFPRNIER